MPPQEKTLEGLREQLKRRAVSKFGPSEKAGIDPSDIVQETLLKYYKQNGPNGTPSNRELHIRLFDTVNDTFKYLHYLKRDIRREQPLATDSENAGPSAAALLKADQSSPSQVVQRDELREQLEIALQDLPEGQRDIVRRRYFEDQQIAEIEEQTGLSRNQISTRLKQGLEALAEILRNKLSH